jgi:hypothetical protein
VSRSAAPGSWSTRAPGALAHRVGEQHLAARRGPQAVLGDLEAALVGDLEPADLLHGVAPELHPDGVVLGGWEDVEDATANGELTAALHQVAAGVCRGREVLDDLLQGRFVAGLQRDGAELAQAPGHGLQHRTHRCHDDVERTEGGVGQVGVGQPPQHGQPLADGVTARAQPLVGQRLPRREVRDAIGLEEAAERGGQVLGLTGGRRDREDGAAALAGQRRDEGRPGARVHGDVGVGHPGPGHRQGARHAGVGSDHVE